MNLRQLLLPIYRSLRPVVDACRLNRIARLIWGALWRRGSTALVRARQNGRVWWLDPEVALRGAEAEIETVHWLQSVVKPGMTVIDVGANVGQMTLEMAHLVGPTGRVIAVEPGPGNLVLLRRHVEANGFSERVTVIAAACCAHHGGEMELEIPGESVGVVGSGFQLSGIGICPNPQAAALPKTKLVVNTVSLDGICAQLARQPAVIKIDVEGAEFEVFQGAMDTLARNRPQMRFGFHPFAFVCPNAVQTAMNGILANCGLAVSEGAEESEWILTEYTVGPTH